LVEKYCANMDNDFKRLFSQALRNIDINAPTLISAGSSGSYFIRGEDNKILAIFKPEDEEPYGINNPKWTKWFQKVCCPCTFGRGCLVPNQVCLANFHLISLFRAMSRKLLPISSINSSI
jgi:phosphatidylinositol 4-kinase type 2